MPEDPERQAEARPRPRPLLHLVAVVVAPFIVLVAAAWPGLHPKVARAGPPPLSALAPYRFPLRGTIDPAREIAFYQKRVALDPADAQDEAMLARIYLHQAKMTSDPAYFLLADQMGRISLEHGPFQNDNAQMVIARVDEAKHDFRGALHICEDVLGGKMQEDALLVKVTCDLGLGRTEAAAQDADQLVKATSNLSSWSTVALVREDQGNESGVEEAWHKAFALEEAGDPYGSAWSRTLYGRWYFRHGQFDQADGLYREALRIYPNFPLALQQLAELDTVLGHYDEAETCYGQAYAVAPMATYLIGKARIRRLRQDVRAADDLDSKATAMLHKDLVSSPLGHGRDLACLLLEQGRPTDVDEAVRIMLKDIGNRRDWLTLDAAAWALQAAKRYPEAESLEREALHSGIHSAQLRWRLAELEEAQGRDAKADYSQALQDNANYQKAHAAVPFML